MNEPLVKNQMVSPYNWPFLDLDNYAVRCKSDDGPISRFGTRRRSYNMVSRFYLFGWCGYGTYIFFCSKLNKSSYLTSTIDSPSPPSRRSSLPWPWTQGFRPLSRLRSIASSNLVNAFRGSQIRQTSRMFAHSCRRSSARVLFFLSAHQEDFCRVISWRVLRFRMAPR